jgi:AraC family transcriptional activator of mtrCDE
MIPDNLFDTLSGLAPLLRVRPELQSLCRFGPLGEYDHEAGNGESAPFHIVTQGTCAIELVGLGRSIRACAGDVVVLPQGARHIVRGVRGPALQRGAAPSFLLESRPDNEDTVEPDTAPEPETELVCGRLNFEQAHRNLVLSALPDAIVITTSDGPDAVRMRRLIAAIKDEIDSSRAGVSAIATDLASALFVMVVRVHLEREHAGTGLPGLLAHRQAGRAVAAMLGDLSEPWTLDALAARANASRASLVRMFQKLAHRAPLEFLSELRLELARRKLATSRLPLGEIAAGIGYQSESAFSRAYRRRFGVPPGEARASAEKRSRAPVPGHRSDRFVTRPGLGAHRSGHTSFGRMVSFGT